MNDELIMKNEGCRGEALLRPLSTMTGRAEPYPYKQPTEGKGNRCKKECHLCNVCHFLYSKTL